MKVVNFIGSIVGIWNTLKVFFPVFFVGIICVIDCELFKSFIQFCKENKIEYKQDTLFEKYSEKKFDESLTKESKPVKRNKREAKNKFQLWRNFHVFYFIIGLAFLLYLYKRSCWLWQLWINMKISIQAIEYTLTPSIIYLTEVILFLNFYVCPFLKALKLNTCAEILECFILIVREIVDDYLGFIVKLLFILLGLLIYIFVFNFILYGVLGKGKQIAVGVLSMFIYNNILLYIMATLVCLIKKKLMKAQENSLTGVREERDLLFKGLRDSTYLILVTLVFLQR